MKFPFLSLMLVLAALPLASHAELGGAAMNASGLNKSIKAAVATSEQTENGYSVKETLPESGGSIKEYVNAQGVVFAVTWRTPVMPNLEALFGSQYFSNYKTETATKPHAGRGPVKLNQADFVVLSGGKLRAFVGKAYVPSLLPAGFDINAI